MCLSIHIINSLISVDALETVRCKEKTMERKETDVSCCILGMPAFQQNMEIWEEGGLSYPSNLF